MRLALRVGALLLAAVGLSPAQVIRGEYIEDRSNHVYGCYCEWSGESQTGGREAVLAWRIQEGEFAGAPLGGLKMAAVIVGEKTLSMGAAPRKSILVIDPTATDLQRQAAEKLLRAKYGALLGEVLSVRAMPISFDRESERAALRIGDVVSVEMHRAEPKRDGMQGAILWFDPFVSLDEPTVGTTEKVQYKGDDFNHRWQRTYPEMTGYYGTFTLR